VQLSAESVWHAAFLQWASNAVKLKFLRFASQMDDGWTDATALFDYGTTRISAGFANGGVLFSNSSGNTYTFDPGDLTLNYDAVNPDRSITRHTYQNTGTINLGPIAQVTGQIQADIIGSSDTLPAGAVVTITPSFEGLTVTIPTALIGTDKENNQALATRALASTSAKSPGGPREIYDVVALGTVDASGANVCTKVRVVPGNPVQVIAAGPGGTISGSLNDPTTPLGLLNLAIQTQCVPLGVTAVLVDASPLVIGISYTLYVNRNTALDDATIKNFVSTSLNELFGSSMPIGGYVVPDALVDGTHPAGSRFIFIDSIKDAIGNATANLSGIVNPVFALQVTNSISGSTDISVGPNQDPILGQVTGTIIRQ
jgi:hypothetical protein